ncbi:MAG: O-antigen ligase family protein [Clostridia bacterium]|nr:O-antigen ligase family protein [Clostridia bacterium]
MSEKHAGRERFALLAGLVLCVFPLAFHTYSDVTRFKFDAMVLVSAALALAALATLPEWRKGVCWISPGRWIGLLYFVLTGCAALFGSMHTLTGRYGSVVWMGAVRYEGMASQLCYGVIFLVMSLYPADVKKTARIAALGIGVYLGVVLLQYADLNPLRLFPKGRSVFTNYEFQGTLGNIDMVNVYLTLTVPLALGSYVFLKERAVFLCLGMGGVLLQCLMEVQSGQMAMVLMAMMLLCAALAAPKYRTRALTVLGLMAFCAMLRELVMLPWLDGGDGIAFGLWHPWRTAAWAGTGVLCMVCAVLLRRTSWRLSKKEMAGAAACMCVIALLLVFLLPLDASRGGLYELHEILHGRAQDSFGSWRWGVWRYTLDMARSAGIFGNGPDTFYEALSGYLKAHSLTLPENFDTPHNLYLGILINHGPLALLSYLALLVYLCVRLYRLHTQSGWVLFCALILYAFVSLFMFSLCLVSPMAWCVLGMASAESDGKRRPKD